MAKPTEAVMAIILGLTSVLIDNSLRAQECDEVSTVEGFGTPSLEIVPFGIPSSAYPEFPAGLDRQQILDDVRRSTGPAQFVQDHNENPDELLAAIANLIFTEATLSAERLELVIEVLGELKSKDSLDAIESTRRYASRISARFVPEDRQRKDTPRSRHLSLKSIKQEIQRIRAEKTTRQSLERLVKMSTVAAAARLDGEAVRRFLLRVMKSRTDTPSRIAAAVGLAAHPDFPDRDKVVRFLKMLNSTNRAMAEALIFGVVAESSSLRISGDKPR